MAVAAAGGVLTLGIVLDGLFNRVDQAIDKAKQAGIDVAQIGSNELRHTIQYAQIQYANSLKLTTDKVDTTVMNWIADITTLVQQVEKGGQNLVKKAQTIANSLPLSKHYIPLLTDASPCSVFRSALLPNPDDIHFTFVGNFADVANLKDQPILTFNKQAHTLASNDGLTLCFKVPFATVFPVNATNKILYTDGSLSIPWVEPGTIPIFKTNHTANFKVLIGAFPPSPGKITFHYVIEKHEKHEGPTAIKQGKSMNSQRGPEMLEYGDKYEGGNNDHHDKDFLGRGTPGWTIIPNTWNTEIARADGDHKKPEFHRHDIQNNTVIFRASTTHKAAGCSGIMLFCIVFDEERYVPIQEQESITLTWGKEYFIKSQYVENTKHGLKNDWSIEFTPFDSLNTTTYTGHDTTTSRYLQVKKEPGGFKVVATLPASIQN